MSQFIQATEAFFALTINIILPVNVKAEIYFIQCLPLCLISLWYNTSALCQEPFIVSKGAFFCCPVSAVSCMTAPSRSIDKSEAGK